MREKRERERERREKERERYIYIDIYRETKKRMTEREKVGEREREIRPGALGQNHPTTTTSREKSRHSTF